MRDLRLLGPLGVVCFCLVTQGLASYTVSSLYTGDGCWGVLLDDARAFSWGIWCSFEASDVASIVGGAKSCTALKTDGTVVTTGQYYFAQSKVDGLTDVQKVFASFWAFAALKSDGTVFTWGQEQESDTSAVADNLTDVVDIVPSSHGFAAIKSDGSYVFWGRYATDPGDLDLSNRQKQLGEKERILFLLYFCGVDRSSPAGITGLLLLEELFYIFFEGLRIKVPRLYGGRYAFALLKNDGSVVTWGEGSGGDSSSVASELSSGVVSLEEDPYFETEGFIVTCPK